MSRLIHKLPLVLAAALLPCTFLAASATSTSTTQDGDAAERPITAAEYGAVLNLSGKQRMLTQKMSKEFLLIAYGHEVDDNRLNLLETYTLFERTLKGLLDGDETLDLPGTEDKAIRDQLGVVQGLWDEFKPHMEFATKSTTTEIPGANVTNVATHNLPLLKNMNAAVGMYEAAATK